MKKLEITRFTSSSRTLDRVVNWTFGWSSKQVDATIKSNHRFSNRSVRSGSGIYGMLVSKSHSSR